MLDQSREEKVCLKALYSCSGVCESVWKRKEEAFAALPLHVITLCVILVSLCLLSGSGSGRSHLARAHRPFLEQQFEGLNPKGY